MKTTLKTACIAILLMIIVMPACQKYDDGPFLSLASAKSRAVNTWKMDRAYSNGSDVTSYFNLLWPSFTIELRKDDNYVTTWSSAIAESGTWTFDNPKENIITTPAGSVITTTWNILKLKKDEMWVKFTDGTGTNWEYQLVTK
jgi:hypothetical protein